MATKPNLIRAIPKTKIKAFDYNYNFDQFQSYVDEVIGDVSGSMPVGAIYQAIRTDVPVNSLRLDGREYTSGFDNFILNYLITGKIITKSYVEWQEEYDNNGGNVGFFAYDADTGKFKVPCIQAGTFLAQAVASGEFGSFLNSEIKSHTHTQDSHAHNRGTQNITGWANGIVMNEDATGTAGGALSLSLVDLGAAGFQGDGEYKGYKININAANNWTGETSYAQPAIHATGGADTYPKHIRYPFFVVVSNVEAESPSQIVWDNFVGNLDVKANKSLNNLDEQGEKHFLNKTQITNCLLEVPQRIKLELNNGVLTLKAGSEVIVPSGFEEDGVTPKFDYVIIESDISVTITSGWATGKHIICYNKTDNSLILRINHASGSLPSGDYTLYYNTSTNVVRDTDIIDKEISLPIGFATVENVAFTSIDQVFNGLGYIGSTVWVDKDVKGLIPNGRNEDGSLRNFEYTQSQVKVETLDNNSTFYIGVGSGVNQSYNYVEQEAEPTTNFTLWYKPSENIMYRKNGSGVVSENRVIYGFKVITGSNGIINFQPKQAFRAVDYSDYVRTPRIIETYANGASWYRKWSDGYCEQGGCWSYTHDARYKSAVLTLLVPLQSVTFQSASAANHIGVSTSCSGIDFSNSTISGTKTQITVWCERLNNTTTSAAGKVYWQINGYI